MADSTNCAASSTVEIDWTSDAKQRELWSALAYSFANLFPGNPNGFYNRRDDGSYVAVEREAEVLDFLAHLCGYPDRALLRVPLLPNGNSRWGAIDVDRHGDDEPSIDCAALSQCVTRLKL